ncbi:MAG: hypothetical protein E6J20_06365 [Chloroflexi bacterium]|nr:MAG: hypothetical protein E6J20_06365 [Chloroflexota bacterium]
MQAQLTIKRFPTALFAFVVALAAAIVLGAALGYALKGAPIAPAHTPVVVTHEQAAGDPRSDLTRVLPTDRPAADTSCWTTNYGPIC